MPSENITIRDIDPSDFYRLVQHYFELYAEIEKDPSFGLIFFDEMPMFVRDLKACAEGNAVGLVAENDAMVVGFCYVDRERPKTAMSHRGGLYLSVKKEFRGKGWARCCSMRWSGDARGCSRSSNSRCLSAITPPSACTKSPDSRPATRFRQERREDFD